MNDARLEWLLDAYFDEQLGKAEREELEYLLLSSPQARQLFWKRARFHSLLRRYGTEYWGKWLAEKYSSDEAGIGSHQQEDTSAPKFGKRWTLPDWFSPGLRWVISGAIAAFALLASLIWLRPTSETLVSPSATKEPVFHPAVAELVRAVGVEWASETNRYSSGAVLTAGSLKLTRGLIELEFYQGARVVIEGPAEFELVSDMEARCLSGKIRVEVPPPAHGFKVLSPNLQVIDVGTSFGLEVRSDGQADIHVFQGEVKMASPSTPEAQQPLTEGQSAQVSQSGEIRSVQLASTDFVSLEEIEQQYSAEMQQRYRAWQAHASRLKEDPSLLVYYDFEGQRATPRTLANHAINAPTESHGTIIGCQWTEGRWPGKDALDFKQFGDRVRFTMPGRFASLTCLAWVRVDGLSHSLNALLMSGKARAGEPQWQLRQTGSMLFGKRILDGWGSDHIEGYESIPVLTPEQMGLWMHLGVAYDLTSRTVRYYLNGQEVSHEAIKSTLLVSLDAMEIGNWTPQIGQPIEPTRNFNGRLDEFAVFGRSLSAEEIRALYEIGRPL